MTKQTFIKGTIILIIAGMITRLLGFINRLVVARMMGEEGVGLYNMSLPTLVLIINLTQISLTIAISKRVSAAEANHDQLKVTQINVISLLITGMIFAVPFIASTLLTDERTIFQLLAISPIVPIIAISSVLKGYFQGKQNMKPQSFALVIEQIVRISFVALIIKWLLSRGIE